MTVLFVFGLLAAFAGAASAHHSVAGFDNKKEVVLKGIVVQFIWRNPHVTLIWNVKGANGETRQWVGELASVTSMIADGMRKDSLKPGQEVEVIACPSMIPGSHEAWIRTIKAADGKVIIDAGRGACTPATPK